MGVRSTNHINFLSQDIMSWSEFLKRRWCKLKVMPTSPAIHQISHQVSLDPYHLHIPWMNIHFLWVFKEQNVLTEKEIERFQDAVQIDQHLIIWPIAIKGDLEKTIRTNCIYHCSSANIISQLFCQKNTFHWKQNQDLPSYFTFLSKMPVLCCLQLYCQALF